MNPKLLKHLRQLCNFTQAELAKEINVHQTLIGKLETGETPIHSRSEEKLKKVFATKGIRERELSLLADIFRMRERPQGRESHE